MYITNIEKGLSLKGIKVTLHEPLFMSGEKVKAKAAEIREAQCEVGNLLHNKLETGVALFRNSGETAEVKIPLKCCHNMIAAVSVLCGCSLPEGSTSGGSPCFTFMS